MGFVSLYRTLVVHNLGRLEPAALLLLRLAVARAFLPPGLARWDGFLGSGASRFDLLLHGTLCPHPGALALCGRAASGGADGSVAALAVKALAVAAGALEVALPALLVAGLFTRPAALGLLAATALVQLSASPAWWHWWGPQAWWAVVLFAVLARGPGNWSVDHWLRLDGRLRV